MKTQQNFYGVIKKLTWVLTLMVWPVCLSAQDYEYSISDGEVTITEYIGEGGDVVIPNEIEGLPVTRIDVEVFAWKHNLTSVIIGDNVRIIRNRAFVSCRGLISVTIPDSVQHIGQQAFASCYSLSSVSMGNSVFVIASQAFERCESLTSINIPNSVTYIGEFAFSRCKSLTSIIIPNRLTYIPRGAFANCSGLVSVTIPNSITTIERSAFLFCGNLTTVTIPDSVTFIGEGVFYGCASLMEIQVAEGNLNYSSIDGILFDKALETLVRFPGGRSGEYVIPDSVTIIRVGAFSGSGLVSVTIPDSVTIIGEGVLGRCNGLMEIQVAEGNLNYSSIDGVLFDKAKETLIHFPGGRSGEYVVPDSVTTILASSFEDGVNLFSLTIPDSVTKIGYCAFAPMRNLTSLYFWGEPVAGEPITGEDPIYWIDQLVVYYVEGTPGWGDFFDGYPTAAFTPWRNFVTVKTEQGTYAKTGNWMGWLWVEHDPWVWSVDMNHCKATSRYFAVSSKRCSRITVTLMVPGYCSSSSMRRRMRRARKGASGSVILSGETMTRISRPAWMA
jgi:hypothetical protein